MDERDTSDLLSDLGVEIRTPADVRNRVWSRVEATLTNEDTVYYDYMAIKNALEELGGEVTIDRDFSGDSDYEELKNEALKNLEE